MSNAEATTTENTAVAEHGAQGAPEKASKKERARPRAREPYAYPDIAVPFAQRAPV